MTIRFECSPVTTVRSRSIRCLVVLLRLGLAVFVVGGLIGSSEPVGAATTTDSAANTGYDTPAVARVGVHPVALYPAAQGSRSGVRESCVRYFVEAGGSSTTPDLAVVATEAAGVAEAGLPSASQLADDVASATGGTIKELPSGYSVAVPNGGRGIVVRVMESGGGRTNYYRVSIPGKEAFTVEGAASVDRALTHIDISANSLEEILQIIKGAGG